MNELFYWTGVVTWVVMGCLACWLLYPIFQLGALAFDIARWRAAIRRENNELWRWGTPVHLARFFLHAWWHLIAKGVPDMLQDKQYRGTWRGYGKWVAHRSLS